MIGIITSVITFRKMGLIEDAHGSRYFYDIRSLPNGYDPLIGDHVEFKLDLFYTACKRAKEVKLLGPKRTKQI